MKGKIRITFIMVNIILLIFIILSYNIQMLQKLEYMIQDNNMRQTASHIPDSRILIIAIDDYSLEELGQFPWDRSIYASFLDTINLEGYEPSAIAFDIVFSEPSDPESDLIFAEGLSKYSNVILPSIAHTEGDVFRTSTVSRDELLQVDHVTYAYDLLSQYTHHAHINRVVSTDGVIRKTWLKLKGPDGESIPSLAYKAVEMAGVDLQKYDEVTDRQKSKDPVAKNTMTIDYELVTDDFLTMSFADVLYGEIPPENFKDTIVFVGFTASGLSGESGQDSGITPIERDSRLVYAHANIANQLLQSTVIEYSPKWLDICLIFIAFLLFLWLPWKFKNLYSFIIVLITVGGILYFQYYSFMMFNYQTSTVYIIAAIMFAYLFNVSLKSYMDQWQKNFVTRQFGRYISPDLVQEIVMNDMEIQLGGVARRITVLFLDIRGFTSISEKLTPAQVVDVLNTIFTMITNVTLEHKGTIDKFIGDAAMILYNAPLEIEKHEEMAVRTAKQIQQEMKAIRQQLLEKYDVNVEIGIGIHTGNVVIGNIGSYLRMDYTAIGDAVNIASRIESGTKGGQVLVSEVVYEATKNMFEYGNGEEKMYKGMSESIKIYELQQ